MKSTTILAGAAIVGLLAIGCGDEKKDAAPMASGSAAAAPKPTVTAAAAPATATAAAVAANDDDIPSEVDFEDEAEKEIKIDNVAAELDALEKEIAAK